MQRDVPWTGARQPRRVDLRRFGLAEGRWPEVAGARELGATVARFATAAGNAATHRLAARLRFKVAITQDCYWAPAQAGVDRRSPSRCPRGIRFCER